MQARAGHRGRRHRRLSDGALVEHRRFIARTCPPRGRLAGSRTALSVIRTAAPQAIALCSAHEAAGSLCASVLDGGSPACAGLRGPAVTAMHVLPGGASDAADMDFFALPFPSDLRLRAGLRSVAAAQGGGSAGQICPVSRRAHRWRRPGRGDLFPLCGGAGSQDPADRWGGQRERALVGLCRRYHAGLADLARASRY